MAEYTYMDAYINQGKNEVISAKNMFDTYLVKDSKNPDHIYRAGFYDFFLKHNADLKDIIQWYSLPQQMFYKPKLLSFQLYNTTELWIALLRVNNMRNSTEFHYPIIQVYEPIALKEIMKTYFKRENKM